MAPAALEANSALATFHETRRFVSWRRPGEVLEPGSFMGNGTEDSGWRTRDGAGDSGGEQCARHVSRDAPLCNLATSWGSLGAGLLYGEWS